MPARQPSHCASWAKPQPKTSLKSTSVQPARCPHKPHDARASSYIVSVEQVLSTCLACAQSLSARQPQISARRSQSCRLVFSPGLPFVAPQHRNYSSYGERMVVWCTSHQFGPRRRRRIVCLLAVDCRGLGPHPNRIVSHRGSVPRLAECFEDTQCDPKFLFRRLSAGTSGFSSVLGNMPIHFPDIPLDHLRLRGRIL